MEDTLVTLGSKKGESGVKNVGVGVGVGATGIGVLSV